MQELLDRKDVAQKDKWKIEDLYATDEVFEEEYKKLSEDYKILTNYEGKLTQSAASLLEYLKEKDKIFVRLQRLYAYAHQKSHEDLGNAVYQDMASRMDALYVQIYSAVSFESPELLTMEANDLQSWVKELPELEEYAHYLDDTIRQKPHTLSGEMEMLLADLGDFSETPSNIFSVFQNVELKFPEVENENHEMVELTNGRYVSFLESKNRDVRKRAFEAMYHTLGKYKNTIASIFAGNVKKELFYTKARKYDSAMQMHLDANAVDTSVYENLLETVHEYLPVMYEYVALRKKLLGLDEIHMYDVYTPIVGEVDMRFSYEDAQKTVLKGLDVMGDEYVSLLKQGFENRWIDVYENRGKRGGAYSWGTYQVHPYVLLNHQDNLDSVFTLAHEMGHSLHSWYSSHNQTFINHDYSIFVAEVASTCNEMLLNQYLLDNEKEPAKRLYLLNHFLETFKGTLFRQAMFAEFEKKVYEMAAQGVTLTADVLCKVYHDLNVLYFGSEMVVDSEIDMEWARIPHFYTPFYVYQYATGISAASAFAKMILEEGEPAVKRYKEKFLSGGCSKYPVDLLADAGVDMRTKAPVAAALELFKSALEETKELVEKMK